MNKEIKLLNYEEGLTLYITKLAEQFKRAENQSVKEVIKELSLNQSSTAYAMYKQLELKPHDFLLAFREDNDVITIETLTVMLMGHLPMVLKTSVETEEELSDLWFRFLQERWFNKLTADGPSFEQEKSNQLKK